MNIKRLCIPVFLLANISSLYGWYGRVIPIAWDNGQWKILLARDADTGNWSDFKAQAPGRKKGNEVAAQALRELTKNLITVQPHELRYYYQDSQGDWVHFVRVNFIRGSDLYTKAQGKKNDFAWITLNDIVSGKQLQTSRGKDITLSNDVKPIIEYIQDNYEAILKSLGLVEEPQKHGETPQQQVGTSWFNIRGAIYFYERGKSYYEFTNFYEDPINLDGKVWPTSEHYYQAQKFTHNPNVQEQIRKKSTAREVFNLAREKKDIVDRDWQQRSIAVMLKAVRAKFNQKPSLANTLLNTQNAILVENAGKNDNFYGAGADGQGQNLLGQILMRVRDELQGTRDPAEDFICYKTPEDYFSQQNGVVCVRGSEQRSPQKPQQTQHYVPARAYYQEDVLTTQLTSLQSKLTDLYNFLGCEYPELEESEAGCLLSQTKRFLHEVSG